MAVSWKMLLDALPRLAMSLLPGVGLVSGGKMSKVLSASAGKKLPGAAFTYPGLTENFDYPINYVGGDMPFNNSSIDRELAYRGAVAQSLEEHNRALAAGGTANEKALQSWWPGEDVKPRVDFSPGSSAVSGVRILPNNKIQIQFRGGGKWYTYLGGNNPREASEAAKDLLMSPSIGRALPRNGKYAHNGPEDKKGRLDKNVGAWGRTHYDPNW